MRSTSSLRPKRRIVTWNGCGVPFGAQRDRLAVEDQLARRQRRAPPRRSRAPRGDVVELARVDADLVARLVDLDPRAVELPLDARRCRAARQRLGDVVGRSARASAARGRKQRDREAREAAARPPSSALRATGASCRRPSPRGARSPTAARPRGRSPRPSRPRARPGAARRSAGAPGSPARPRWRARTARARSAPPLRCRPFAGGRHDAAERRVDLAQRQRRARCRAPRAARRAWRSRRRSAPAATRPER